MKVAKIPVYPPNTNMLFAKTTAEWWYLRAGGEPVVTTLPHEQSFTSNLSRSFSICTLRNSNQRLEISENLSFTIKKQFQETKTTNFLGSEIKHGAHAFE